MSALVDAIRAERLALIEPLLAPIADKLVVLDEMERLARSINGGGSDVSVLAAPVKPAARKSVPRALPAKVHSTRVGLDGLPDRTREVLAAVRALGGWVSASEVAASMGAAANAMRKHLQRLVERGLLEAQGETVARRYRSVTEDKAWSGEIVAPRALPAPVVDEHGSDSSPSFEEAKPEQAPAQTKSVAKDHGLTTQGLKIVRARILDHCSRRRLDEQSLASTLNVDREVVADLCGQLLVDELIVLRPDGRYEVPA